MLGKLMTETRNPHTMNLDEMSALEIVTVMNREDATVSVAIEKVLPEIARTVEAITQCFRQGGRLVYCGAGTSGRLGVLDAAECVPTFGVSPEMVVGVLAGGEKALVKSSEGLEDECAGGVADMKKIGLSSKDFLVGLAASGRTPYVIGALQYAGGIGTRTCAVSSNIGAEISQYAEIAIELETGPEVLTGSTRLKSGTGQKLVLNMLSTASMVGIGKAYKNLMVDVSPTNVKLVDRAIRIIMEATGVDEDEGRRFLEKSGNNPKVAIVMICRRCGKREALERLEVAGGFVGRAL